MKNAYHSAIEARLATAIANDCSKSNEKKMRKLAAMLSNNELAKLLKSAAIDAERFTRAIYACEKVVKFASQAVSLNAKDLNENTFAIFRTAMNCYKHNVALTQNMIEASISRNVKIDDSVKHLVYQRAIVQSDNTIAAQTQTSRDALETLKIITARSDVKSAYDVNMTALASKLCEQFKIDATREVENA